MNRSIHQLACLLLLLAAAASSPPALAREHPERMPAHERETLRHELRQQGPDAEPRLRHKLSAEQRRELRMQLRERHRQTDRHREDRGGRNGRGGRD
ncbi:MAG: hypothetical protein VW339_09105 [Quisquiliibacterium sp.]